MRSITEPDDRRSRGITPNRNAQEDTDINAIVSSLYRDLTCAAAALLIVLPRASAAAITFDTTAFGDQSSSRVATVITAPFSTAGTNELLLAFVGADDAAPGNTVASVTGLSVEQVRRVLGTPETPVRS